MMMPRCTMRLSTSRTNGWIDWWIDWLIDELIDGWFDGWMDMNGCIDGWYMDGWMVGGWMDGRTEKGKGLLRSIHCQVRGQTIYSATFGHFLIWISDKNSCRSTTRISWAVGGNYWKSHFQYFHSHVLFGYLNGYYSLIINFASI